VLGIKRNPRRRPWRWGGVRELLELELEVRGGLWRGVRLVMSSGGIGVAIYSRTGERG
jgi:hypothetical protein